MKPEPIRLPKPEGPEWDRILAAYLHGGILAGGLFLFSQAILVFEDTASIVIFFILGTLLVAWSILGLSLIRSGKWDYKPPKRRPST